VLFSRHVIFRHSKNLNKLVLLLLQQSYSRSVLTYSAPAIDETDMNMVYSGIQLYEDYLIIVSGNL